MLHPCLIRFIAALETCYGCLLADQEIASVNFVAMLIGENEKLMNIDDITESADEYEGQWWMERTTDGLNAFAGHRWTAGYVLSLLDKHFKLLVRSRCGNDSALNSDIGRWAWWSIGMAVRLDKSCNPP